MSSRSDDAANRPLSPQPSGTLVVALFCTDAEVSAETIIEAVADVRPLNETFATKKEVLGAGKRNRVQSCFGASVGAFPKGQSSNRRTNISACSVCNSSFPKSGLASVASFTTTPLTL